MACGGNCGCKNGRARAEPASIAGTRSSAAAVLEPEGSHGENGACGYCPDAVSPPVHDRAARTAAVRARSGSRARSTRPLSPCDCAGVAHPEGLKPSMCGSEGGKPDVSCGMTTSAGGRVHASFGPTAGAVSAEDRPLAPPAYEDRGEREARLELVSELENLRMQGRSAEAGGPLLATEAAPPASLPRKSASLAGSPDGPEEAKVPFGSVTALGAMRRPEIDSMDFAGGKRGKPDDGPEPPREPEGPGSEPAPPGGEGAPKPEPKPCPCDCTCKPRPPDLPPPPATPLGLASSAKQPPLFEPLCAAGSKHGSIRFAEAIFGGGDLSTSADLASLSPTTDLGATAFSLLGSGCFDATDAGVPAAVSARADDLPPLPPGSTGAPSAPSPVGDPPFILIPGPFPSVSGYDFTRPPQVGEPDDYVFPPSGWVEWDDDARNRKREEVATGGSGKGPLPGTIDLPPKPPSAELTILPPAPNYSLPRTPRLHPAAALPGETLVVRIPHGSVAEAGLLGSARSLLFSWQPPPSGARARTALTPHDALGRASQPGMESRGVRSSNLLPSGALGRRARSTEVEMPPAVLGGVDPSESLGASFEFGVPLSPESGSIGEAIGAGAMESGSTLALERGIAQRPARAPSASPPPPTVGARVGVPPLGNAAAAVRPEDLRSAASDRRVAATFMLAPASPGARLAAPPDSVPRLRGAAIAPEGADAAASRAADARGLRPEGSVQALRAATGLGPQVESQAAGQTGGTGLLSASARARRGGGEGGPPAWSPTPPPPNPVERAVQGLREIQSARGRLVATREQALAAAESLSYAREILGVDAHGKPVGSNKYRIQDDAYWKDLGKAHIAPLESAHAQALGTIRKIEEKEMALQEVGWVA